MITQEKIFRITETDLNELKEHIETLLTHVYGTRRNDAIIETCLKLQHDWDIDLGNLVDADLYQEIIDEQHKKDAV